MFLLLVSQTWLAALNDTGNAALRLQTQAWCCKQTPKPNSINSSSAYRYSTAALAWLTLHLMVLPSVPQLWPPHHRCGPACRLCRA